MASKKYSEEELLETHVLNLQEIREAEKKEQLKKIKKTPLIFLVFGIFLIVIGSLSDKVVNIFTNNKNTNNTIEYATKTKKDTLICLSDFIEESNTFKISTKTTYKFQSSGLASKESLTTIKMVNEADVITLEVLKNHYNGLYLPVIGGVTNKIYTQNNQLYFSQTIKDYKLFDINLYNDEINRVNKTTLYLGGENIKKVKEKEIALGNSCS